MPICRECRLGVPASYDACPKCGNPLVAPKAPAAAMTRPADDYESFFVRAASGPAATVTATALVPATGPVEPEWARARPLPEDVAAAASESPADRAARGSVLKTVAVAIGLGVLVLVVASMAVDTATDSVLHRLGIGLSLTTLLYVAVALIVASKLRTSPIQPRLAEGSRATGIVTGAFIGGALGLGLGLVNSLLSGHVTSDPRILSVIFEGNGALAFILVFISVIAAPLVEEILFRGLLVESLRSRGRSSAILAGAVAFSLWHLNPVALRYYVLMGFLFGWLYWRFGLAGSVSAHAVFNGVLVVFAFAALSGSSVVTTTSGVTVRLPGGWHEAHTQTLAGLGLDVAAGSPLGAGFAVGHADLQPTPGTEFAPTARLPSADSLPPGATDVRDVTVSGTAALRFTITHGTEESTLVLVPRGSRRYVVTLVPHHDDKARRDLDAMLSSLRLP